MDRDLTGLVAHDANLALQALKRDVAALQIEALAPLGEKQRHAVEQMAQNLEILRTLLGPPESVSSRAAPVDLSPIIDQIYTALRGQFEARGVRFRRGTLPSVLGREGDLRRVFLNLLANSLMHMGNAPEREIEVGSRADGNQVVITVRDTGPGFSPEALSGMTGHSSEPARGLRIVGDIVHAHNGSIQVESTPGAGATIYIRLPRAYRRLCLTSTGL